LLSRIHLTPSAGGRGRVQGEVVGTHWELTALLDSCSLSLTLSLYSGQP
jgi:hypothetical protein